MKTPSSPAQCRNRLLARLPTDEYQILLPHLEAVPFPFKLVLYSARSRIDYAYFPQRGVLSALTIMVNGDAIEVASIGNEGMVGLMALVGAGISPNEIIVQVAGEGLRMRADVFKEVAGRAGPLRQVFLLYQSAYATQVSYAVACNGLHTVQQRCCRWLLMTQDRVEADVLALTHEFLAIMLGVRRASVSEVLQPLQEGNLIQTRRGKITVLDRKGLQDACCECYKCVQDEFARLFC